MTTFQFRLISADVLDGDTLRVTLDLGMRLTWKGELRLHGCNAPEIHSKNSLEKAAGISVKGYVETWISSINTGNGYVYSYDWDKYGRLLGDVSDQKVPSRTLANDLISTARVKLYNGGFKEPWTDDELHAIIHLGVKS